MFRVLVFRRVNSALKSATLNITCGSPILFYLSLITYHRLLFLYSSQRLFNLARFIWG